MRCDAIGCDARGIKSNLFYLSNNCMKAKKYHIHNLVINLYLCYSFYKMNSKYKCWARMNFHAAFLRLQRPLTNATSPSTL